MSTFTNPISFKPIAKGRYVTLESFTFFLRDDQSGEAVTIQAGTVFNGASIPKLVRKLFGWNPVDFRWLQATIVHDALVGEFASRVKTNKGRKLSWNEAADWFDAALRVKRSQYPSCPPLNRELFVKSVKIYGFLTGKR